ncbi:SCO family protein [Rickettsiales endosymbiont of Stachyamoeba lipophora]|uniref:SCO family protein n=1 Tax=Rickettsiales endosymbiont of Stachyamoeba lipophora TaxID=2486578 RepID=UPI000F64FAE2|nr:SCO family protein [Rickettsiales endosymbiont of Stachyamoeba lipophora]AZL15007.1 SCO family protein [Rickettsiales endosymbiont of Stachyamoeba lipophora]
MKRLILGIIICFFTNFANAEKAAIGGQFQLIDTQNQTVTEKALLGKYTLIYFGFTTCPHICPMAVNNMSNVYDYLTEKEIKKVGMYFITVDPRRDDIKKLTDFMSNFDPKIVGLTGHKEQIEQAINSYRVFTQETQEVNDKGEYLINHSSFIYLMGPDGNYITHFEHEATGKAMAKRLKSLLKK